MKSHEKGTIAEISARCAAATEGPWQIDERLPNCYIRHEGQGFPIAAMWHTANGSNYKNDAAFIAHARQDIPVLLAEIERLSKRDSPLMPQMSDSGAFFICPNCDKLIEKHERAHGNIIIPHCKWCGQALDWGGSFIKK